MKKLLVLSLLAFLISPCFSQNEPPGKIKETMELNGDSFTKEIKVTVSEGKTLRYTVKGKITNGYFKVKVYDPTGKKENGFGLSTGEEGGTAKGSLEEVNTDPIPGIWVFKIDNKNSKGEVTFTVNQNNRGL